MSDWSSLVKKVYNKIVMYVRCVLLLNWLKYFIVKTVESISKNKQLNISSAKRSLKH